MISAGFTFSLLSPFLKLISLDLSNSMNSLHPFNPEMHLPPHRPPFPTAPPKCWLALFYPWSPWYSNSWKDHSFFQFDLCLSINNTWSYFESTPYLELWACISFCNWTSLYRCHRLFAGLCMPTCSQQCLLPSQEWRHVRVTLLSYSLSLSYQSLSPDYSQAE